MRWSLPGRILARRQGEEKHFRSRRCTGRRERRYTALQQFALCRIVRLRRSSFPPAGASLDGGRMHSLGGIVTPRLTGRRALPRRPKGRRCRIGRCAGGAGSGEASADPRPLVLAAVLLTLGAGAVAGAETGPSNRDPGSASGPVASAAADRPATAIPTEAGPVAIGPGEVHYRDLDLEAGVFVRLIVEQKGIDVAIQLNDPEGRPMIRVDSPNGDRGLEELVAIAAGPGPHRFEVVAPAGAAEAGRYAFQIAERRPATADDRELVAADRAYHRARGLRREGRSAEALDGFRAALATFRRLRLTSREADVLRETSLTHRDRGELELAALLAERAAILYLDLGDSLQAAVAVRNGGQYRLQAGQPERAQVALQEALRLYEEAGWARGVVLTTVSLGAVDYRLGRLQSALRLFERAAALARSQGDEEAEALALCELGSNLLALHRPREALTGFERAREVYERREEAHNVAVALIGVAQAAIQLGDYDRAEPTLAMALGLLTSPAQRRDRATALRALGDLRRRRSDFAGARTALVEGLDLAREVDDRRTEAVLLIELGHLETLTGDPERGLALQDQALAAFADLDDARGAASARARGAQALVALGRLREAEERLAPALAAIESLRAHTERGDVRTSYFALRQDYYEIAIGALMALHRQEPQAGHRLDAFRINERRLARELVDDLAEEPTAVQPDPALQAEQQRLEDEISELAAHPARGDEGAERAIADRLARLETVRGRLRERAPEDGAMPSPEVATAAEAQALLDERTALLVYALGDEQSVLWCLTPKGVTAWTLPPRDEIETLAATFARVVSERSRFAAGLRRQLGERLGRTLLAPAADRIVGRRLAIVADGELQRLPFAALPVPGDPERYLIEEHEIGLLPSVTALAILRRSPTPTRPRRPRIVAFADPVYDDADLRLASSGHAPAARPQLAELTRAAGEIGVDPFERLPFTRDEVEGILEQAPGGGHLLAAGFDASRETLAETDLSGFAILHFATHALLHPEHPELSGLVLSLVGPDGQPRDGFLRAFEISRLRLPVELVVLSACESGVGRDLRGEGMASLARSFFHAGARRVVATLWRVSDQRTATLMVRFYRGLLSEGQSPAAALRAAQLAALGEEATRAPYYWAGFTFQGDWREVRW